jgi:hypothetical protein
MVDFMPCTKMLTEKGKSEFVLYGSYILHGLLGLPVSDRDPKIVGGLWETLWSRLATWLDIYSGQHPEVDDQTELVYIISQQLMRSFRCYDGS